MNISSPNKAGLVVGRFDIACSSDAEGITCIREQFVKAPFHLSKPYWDGNVLVIQAVNSTAGVFAGDRLTSEIMVEQGAQVLFTTPSAHRIYSMPQGHAEMVQSFYVAKKAWLEVMPELFIPQRDCRYRHTTQIDVEAGGELFFAEYLAPGRVAHDEKFSFTEVDWKLDIRVGDSLVVHERFVLKPDDSSLWSLKKCFPVSYYAACYLVTKRWADPAPVQKFFEELDSSAAVAGGSRLTDTMWSFKILAASSEALRKTVSGIRELLALHLPPLRSSARKL